MIILVVKLLYIYFCPYARMSVRKSVCPSCLGKTWFSRPLIKIEVWFLRASLLIGVIILFFIKQHLSQLFYNLSLFCLNYHLSVVFCTNVNLMFDRKRLKINDGLIIKLINGKHNCKLITMSSFFRRAQIFTSVMFRRIYTWSGFRWWGGRIWISTFDRQKIRF